MGITPVDNCHNVEIVVEQDIVGLKVRVTQGMRVAARRELRRELCFEFRCGQLCRFVTVMHTCFCTAFSVCNDKLEVLCRHRALSETAPITVTVYISNFKVPFLVNVQRPDLLESKTR